MKKKVLIIGGGMSGCASAELLSEIKNLEITLVEQNSFLGAGVRTHFYGGHPYTFGPRHFLTKKREVYEYLNSKLPLRNCSEHQFITYVEKDNQFYNYPLHLEDVQKMPDREKVMKELNDRSKSFTSTNLKDYWIQSIGPTLFGKVIENYNKKMWQVEDCSEIDTFSWSPKGATIKTEQESKAAWSEAISAYPIAEDGYNSYFENSVKNINVMLNTSAKIKDLKKKIFTINNEDIQFDIVISSTSPDILMNFELGELPYIGRDIHKIVFPTEYVFPKDIYFLYFANDEKFTRLTEYKKFTKHKSPTTLISLEIPSKNGRHYPLPQKKWQKLAESYISEFPEWMYSVGRNGNYYYSVDIDDCIYQAMLIKEDILNNTFSSNIPGEEYSFENRT